MGRRSRDAMTPEVEARAAAHVPLAAAVAWSGPRPSLWDAVRGRNGGNEALAAGAFDADIEELELMAAAHATPEQLGLIRARKAATSKG